MPENQGLAFEPAGGIPIALLKLMVEKLKANEEAIRTSGEATRKLGDIPPILQELGKRIKLVENTLGTENSSLIELRKEVSGLESRMEIMAKGISMPTGAITQLSNDL